MREGRTETEGVAVAESDAGQAAPARVRESSFAGDVLKLGAATTASQVMGVVVAPILARLYSPDDFGVATVFLSIISIVSVVSCLRYELAIVLPKQDGEAANVLALSLGLALITSLVCAILMVASGQGMADLLNTPGLGRYLWLVPIALLATGAFQPLSYWNSRARQFGRLSRAQLSGAVVRNATQVGWGVVARSGASGLVGGIVLGSATMMGALARRIWLEDRRFLRSHVRWPQVIEALKRYRKFPLVDSWGGLLNTVSASLPALMLSALFSQTIVGYYGLTNRLISLPVTLIGRAIGQVFYQRSSELSQADGTLAQAIETVFVRLVLLGLLPALVLTVAGSDLVVFVFGGNWREAGVYVQILALWAFFWFLYAPLSTLFAVVERQELFLIAHLTILVTRVAALSIGGALDSVYLGLGLFGGTGVLMYAGLGIWAARLGGMSARSALRILARHTLYCLPPAGLLLALKLWAGLAPGWLTASSAAILLMYYVIVIRRDPALRRTVMAAWCRLTRLLSGLGPGSQVP